VLWVLHQVPVAGRPGRPRGNRAARPPDHDLPRARVPVGLVLDLGTENGPAGWQWRLARGPGVRTYARTVPPTSAGLAVSPDSR